jgi:hypothetical protein
MVEGFAVLAERAWLLVSRPVRGDSVEMESLGRQIDRDSQGTGHQLISGH